MNKQTKLILAILAIFIVGMTFGVAFADPVDAKTFKSKSGYKWKIKSSTWKKMKKQAKKQYKSMRKLGSSYPGYSKAVKVTVTKGSYKSKGVALAVQNDYYMRCEVRGATKSGYYITCKNV